MALLWMGNLEFPESMSLQTLRRPAPHPSPKIIPGRPRDKHSTFPERSRPRTTSSQCFSTGGRFCPLPRGHWATSGDICGCHTGGLLAPRGWGPGMLLHTPQRPGQAHSQEQSSPKVSGAEGRHPGLRAENWLKPPSPRDSPGSAVVKNLAGDTGSSPGLGRSHMLQSN